MTSLAVGLGLTACQRPPETAPAVAPAATTPAPAVVQDPAPVVPVESPATVLPAPAEAAKTPASQDFADAPINRFEAVGYSPAWTATLQGNQLSFDVPETTGVDTPLRVITVTRSAYAKGANYDGMDGKTSVSLDLRGERCDRTGENTEFTATLRYGQSTYHGCAQAK